MHFGAQIRIDFPSNCPTSGLTQSIDAGGRVTAKVPWVCISRFGSVLSKSSNLLVLNKVIFCENQFINDIFRENICLKAKIA